MRLLVPKSHRYGAHSDGKILVRDVEMRTKNEVPKKDGSVAAYVLLIVAAVALLVFVAEASGVLSVDVVESKDDDDDRTPKTRMKEIAFRPFSPPRASCSDVLFIKMQKCASSTFLGVLKHVQDRCNSQVQNSTNQMHLVWGESPLTRLRKTPGAVALRKSHLVLTVMREPLSRQISHFHQCRHWKEKGECKKWAQLGAESFFRLSRNTRVDNLQARFLGWDPKGRKTPDQHVEQLDFILIKERLHEGLCLLHLLSDLVHVTDMLYVSYKARSAEDLQKSEDIMADEGHASAKISEEALGIARKRSKADLRAYKAALGRHQATVAAVGFPRVTECVARYEQLLQEVHRACGHRAENQREDGRKIRRCLDELCASHASCARNDLFCGTAASLNATVGVA